MLVETPVPLSAKSFCSALLHKKDTAAIRAILEGVVVCGEGLRSEISQIISRINLYIKKMTDLVKINKKCMSLISKHLLTGNGEGKYEACKIYEKLVDERSNEHNCLGCQFMNLHQEIYDNFTQINPSGFSIEFYFKTYIFWLYQNVERIYEIFEMINPDSRNSILKTYFEKNFITTKRIKRWTNFIKHPKAFKFTHHPKYFFESDLTDRNNLIILDTKEIEKFYSGTSKNKELYIKIAKKENVVVAFPNLVELTKNFCKEFITFTKFICENEIIASALKEETTIANYYGHLDYDPIQDSIGFALNDTIENVEWDIDNKVVFIPDQIYFGHGTKIENAADLVAELDEISTNEAILHFPTEYINECGPFSFESEVRDYLLENKENELKLIGWLSEI